MLHRMNRIPFILVGYLDTRRCKLYVNDINIVIYNPLCAYNILRNLLNDISVFLNTKTENNIEYIFLYYTCRFKNDHKNILYLY